MFYAAKTKVTEELVGPYWYRDQPHRVSPHSVYDTSHGS